MDHILGRPCLLLIFALFFFGCSPNKPWRTDEPDGVICTEKKPCNEKAYIQEYDNFDLAFVEFTERGNLFSRSRMEKVIDHVKEKAKNGVYVFVYVHGWRHNAKVADTNVEEFSNKLRMLAELKKNNLILQNQDIVGIYVGWRGLSSLTPGFKLSGNKSLPPYIKYPLSGIDNLLSTIELPSYWDRKSLAHEVGKGGVTELLLRLENILKHDNSATNDNFFQVVGHSMGGAITLSALNEIMMERIILAKLDDNCAEGDSKQCRYSEPFGHGVVLMNPAIEANQVMQLKEVVTKYNYPEYQDVLMHIISSSGDTANIWPFYFGQLASLGITWKHEDIERTFDSSTTPVVFDELDLDTTTVAQFKPFRTGFLKWDNETWIYHSCDKEDDGSPRTYPCVKNSAEENEGENCVCGIKEAEFTEKSVPSRGSDPIAYIYTDTEFIENHNDIFNEKVSAYLAAILDESRTNQTIARQQRKVSFSQKKKYEKFNFGQCYADYFEFFKKLNELKKEQEGKIVINDDVIKISEKYMKNCRWDIGRKKNQN